MVAAKATHGARGVVGVSGLFGPIGLHLFWYVRRLVLGCRPEPSHPTYRETSASRTTVSQASLGMQPYGS